jgi:HAD superfamily hydrolase (TIGR01509 family)
MRSDKLGYNMTLVNNEGAGLKPALIFACTMQGVLMEFEAIIFDVDGLMFDTERIARDSWKQAMAEAGYELSDALYLTFIGHSLADITPALKAAFGKEIDVLSIFSRRMEIADRLYVEEGVPVKDGLKELLDFLETRGKRKGVASSSYKEVTLRKLTLAGIADRFETIVGGDEVPEAKPAPYVYQKAAQQMGVEPQRCLALEDSEPGLQAARAAGLTPFMVPDLIAPTPVTRALAERVFPSLHEVRRYLAGFGC